MIFGREFADTGLTALDERPAWWKDVLEARFEDASGRKRPLFLAVRDRYLNAYVEGQSIYRVKFNAAAKPSLHAEIHHKYVLEAAEGQKYLRFDGNKAGDVHYTGRVMLDHWIKKARDFAGDEKRGVAAIADNNPHVIDVEMALPGHRSRIDMVALERHDSAIRITFYEAKCFGNPSLVSNTKPEVFEQLRKYAKWLGADGGSELLVKCYRRTCQVLLALRGMQGQTIHPLLAEAAKEGSNLVIDPEPRLVIFGYTTSALHPNWHNKHRPALETAGLSGVRLIIAPSARDILLPDGLTTEISEASAEPQLAELARFADVFAAPGFSIGQWSNPSPSPNGITKLPWFDLSDGGEAFYEAVYKSGWIMTTNWSDWMEGDKAKTLFASNEAVTRATMDDLRHMLTAVIRGERFCEGTIADAFDKGTLTAIVQRARALLNDQAFEK